MSALPMPAAATSTLPPLGMHMHDADDLMQAGAAPRYGTFWIGEWTSSSGWGALENVLRTGKSFGVTPVIHWFYWGDSISPSCVEYGCDGRDRAEWYAMTDQMAGIIRNEMGGREVVVVLENEFNKGGITDSWYAPTFDSHLQAIAGKLDAVSGVKLVVGFGAWGESSWERFPKAIAASDYVGFQMMRASTKDTESSYRAAADRIVYFTDFVSTKFNKPSFLYDLALSSYADAHWERVQAETLSRIFDKLTTTTGSTGLQAVLYRTLVDNPNMGLHNYYGYAERHWGLKKAWNQGDKPAWEVWKSKANGGASGGTPTEFTTHFENVRVEEWWVQANVWGTKTIAKVEGRLLGGDWVDMPKQSWGAYGKGINVKSAQCVEFRAIAADGSIDTTGAYARGGGPCPATPPSFSATFENWKVDEWWVHTYVKANLDIASVHARVDGGTWVELSKQSWTAYGKGMNVKSHQCVEFRATGTDGSAVTSGKYGRGGGPCPETLPAFSATFERTKVDEWWLHTYVNANHEVARVHARVDGGSWVELSKQSWGAYGKGMNVKWNECVEFRATSTDGSTATSGRYARGGGACTTSGGSTAPTTFDATFSGLKVDEWWVQASVSGTKAIAKVEARVVGDSWVELPKQSWGAYAKSMNVKWGECVEFRATATDGSTDTSSAYGRGGGACVAFTASFTGVKVGDWWVQTGISGANKPVAKVEARVNGGSWVQLDDKGWGYAKAVRVHSGQYVEFRATANDGTSLASGKHWR